MKSLRPKHTCLFLFLTFQSFLLFAQEEAFLYGEIELRDETRIKGKITWSAGQSLWVDLLVAEKKDNPILQHLNKEEIEKLSAEKNNTDWNFMALWKNQYPTRKLTFRTQFGNLLEIRVTGEKDATVVLKNETLIRLYINDDIEYKNQFGAEISITAENGKKTNFPWTKIERIRFYPTPKLNDNSNSKPLYGTLTTRTGYSYQGLIKWDLNEHLDDQYLDGISIDGKRIRYHFYDVKSIRPKNRGSLIQLQSEKEIYLHSKSNVTNENKGILVRNPQWGQINLRWGDFKSAIFTPYTKNSGFAYTDFPIPATLQGRVSLKDNRSLEGQIFFDLDEQWDIETLDGWGQGGGLRQVPFRLIDKIYPVSNTHSAVILRGGEKIVLGDRSDVNDQNWGIMVQTKNDDFHYVPWSQLRQIEFDH
ncbi:hypothetical protein [Echinicola sp. 20G]|uniref:hypothetical protein n=1 Tax=Echinicola sp. 20G TaxID=2781961 RepID=UPI00190FE133|nr:hypothetical protein [Echinicola sp. 20G]